MKLRDESVKPRPTGRKTKQSAAKRKAPAKRRTTKRMPSQPQPQPQPQPESDPSLTDFETATFEPGDQAPEMTHEDLGLTPIQVADPEAEADTVFDRAAEAGVAASEPPRPALMGADGFFETYSPLFPTAAGIEAMIYSQRARCEVPPLQSLMTLPEHPHTRRAMDALYRIIERYPSMHFIISDGATFAGDILVVGTFGYSVSVQVKADFAARNAALSAQAGLGEGGGDA